MATNPPVKSVETAFRIVELLVEHGAINLSTVASELGLAKSTVHDHLSTLRQMGYVRKVGQEYKANLRFLELGGKIRGNQVLFNVAEPELQKVANTVGEHTSLMIKEGEYGVYVYTAPGDHLQQVIVPIGTHTRLHVSAPGKAILAHLPEEQRVEFMDSDYLKPVTENTITDLETLRVELEEIRETKRAVDNEEGKEGLQGIAKPIISRETRDVVGAISVYGPSGRANMEFLRGEVLKALERAANVIEHELDVTPPR